MRTLLSMPCLCAAALLALPGCGDAEIPVPAGEAVGVYVGAIDQADADAAVALVAEGGQVSFYVCGGASTVETHTRWLSGSVDGQALDVEKDGWSASGIVDGELAGGQLVREDGAPLTWSAHRVTEGTIAGLYATVDEGCKTGVVVAQDSPEAAPTMQGSWCNQAGSKMQVTPILPIALAEGGIAVQVMLPAGARKLHVERVSLAK